MATFIGSKQGGILGSFLATLGVVFLPHSACCFGEYKTQPVPICRPKPGSFAVFTEIYCSLFQTDGRCHCRINHFAATVTPATLIKDQILDPNLPPLGECAIVVACSLAMVITPAPTVCVICTLLPRIQCKLMNCIPCSIDVCPFRLHDFSTLT